MAIIDHDDKNPGEESSKVETATQIECGDSNYKENDKDKAIVVLRPVWKGIIAVVLILICLLVVYNLIHTIDRIKHPTVREDKHKKISSASEIDTHWYQNQKIKVSSESSTSPINKIPALQSNEISKSDIDHSQEEVKKAMSANISSNQIVGDPPKDDSKSKLDEGVPVDQENHTNVSIKNILEKMSKTQKPVSPYIIQAGTIIPGVLISGINSDLPGQVIAQVRNPVYDSLAGKFLLIPQGSKLIGHYDAKLCFGQKRLFLVWERVLFPNGDSIQMGDMPGTDSGGYAGFKDQVNNHYGSIFSSALLMSILSTGAQASSPPSTTTTSMNVGQTLAQSVGMHLTETGSLLISKTLEVQPTVNIRPGYLFNITVTKDIVFDQSY